MGLEIVSASRLSLDELARLFSRSFEEYVVPIHMEPTLLAEMMRVDGHCHEQSRVLLRDGEPAGLALVARKGGASRIAAMGLAREARGVGRGRTLVERLLQDARDRGDAFVELEVIEQNPGAVRLYEKCGFRRIRRLLGFEREPDPIEQTEAALAEVEPRGVGLQMLLHGGADLPWQIGGEALVRLTPPCRGYRLGPAWAVIGDPTLPEIRLRGMVVETKARRQGWGRRLLRALVAAHPEHRLRVTVLVPEECGTGLFEPVGFKPLGFTQWQMRCPL